MRGVPGHLAGTVCASLGNAGGFVSISRTRGRELAGWNGLTAPGGRWCVFENGALGGGGVF